MVFVISVFFAAVSASTLSPTVSPTQGPTTPSPTRSPTLPIPVCGTPAPSASYFSTPAALSDGLFAYRERGPDPNRTLLAIAFARFFLSDVIDVKTTGVYQNLQLGSCGSSSRTGIYYPLALCPYQALRPSVAIQTPQFDLGSVYGTTASQKAALKVPNSYLLNFRTVATPADSSAFDMQPRPSDVYLFVAGARNANLDHFSLYLHSRWIYLHNKIARWIAGSTTNEAQANIFNATQVFVQAIARNMVQDFIGPYGPFSDLLPVGYNATDIKLNGIPPEFLLVNWFDSFPESFNHYVDQNPNQMWNKQPGASYRSTVYNATLVVAEPVWVDATLTNSQFDSQLLTTVPKLGVFGFNGQYVQALVGGSYSDTFRCGTGSPFGDTGVSYDLVAATIQRGRDNVFPSCNAYRRAHGLPNITFSQFGSGPFAKTFAALHNYDVSTVELSTCLLLDPKLRNQMVASLMQAVLALDDPTTLPCNSGISPGFNFASTAVSGLSSFAAPSAGLVNLMNLICKGETVRVSMRALVELEKLRLDSRGVYFISGFTASKYYECTTADPFFSASGRIQTRLSQSSFVMEDKSQTTNNCNWRDRIEISTTGWTAGVSYALANNPACLSLSPPANALKARQCFDAVETGCLGRGVLTGTATCDCDYGYVVAGTGNLQINNASAVPLNIVCEHWRYPRTSQIPSYFSTVNSGCSHTMVPSPPSGTYSVVSSAASSYCVSTSSSTCPNNLIGVGNIQWGGCHSAATPDVGRAYSQLGRILPPSYSNGINCANCATNQTAFTQEFHQRYPVNNSNIAHNALWRAVGMLLVRDVFSNPSTSTNVSGARSGTSTANPAQFLNNATGWVDLSPLYGNPPDALPTSQWSPIIGSAANLFTTTILNNKLTDLTQEERYVLTMLATRHNQLYNYLSSFSSPSDTTLNSIGGLCARELVLEEWRAIANEFISASKCYYRTVVGDSNPAKFNFSQHGGAVPLEAGGAKIFQVHHTPQGLATGCSGTPVVGTANSQFDRTCINNLANMNLNAQTDISGLTAAQFSSINVAQLYGLPAVDAYVAALGRSFDYTGTVSPNLLLGLRKSAADYAINFGLIESILAEQSVRDATASCYVYASWASGNTGSSMGGYMPGGALAIPRATSLAGLLTLLASTTQSSPTPFASGSAPPRAGLFYDAGACS